MSTGALLVAIAITTILVGYITEPFRRQPGSADKTVESWIAQARAAQDTPPSPPAAPIEVAAPPVELQPPSDDVVNFCPRCGRKVAPDHQFCPGCGTRLRPAG